MMREFCGVSGTKVGRMFVMLAVLLAVVGAGLSYSGYNESLQILTVTSTQQTTVTSTRTVATASREFVLMTTSSTNWILQDEIINLPGSSFAPYCYIDSLHVYLEAGQVHVSYHTDGRPIDFWMMNDDDYTRWQGIRYCSELKSFQGIRKPFVSKLSRSGYEFTSEVSSAGVYYFAFLSGNFDPVSVTLNVDTGMQVSQVTITREKTLYSTHVTPIVTERVTSTEHLAGFGLLFYAGIGLIGAAAIALVMSRTKNVVPKAAPLASVPVVPTSPVVSTPLAPTAGKFCISCGTPLPAHAIFCNKCGTKQ
jgi:hypothetical protein